MKKNLLGPPCRKCDGKGHYCVELPLTGDPPDNRRHCEICGGQGFERVKKNPIADNPKLLSSLGRDELISLLRSIVSQHIRYAGWDTDPVRVLIESELQKMKASR
jgi:hypothetical protein